MFAGNGVSDNNPLIETTAPIPVNTLESASIVIDFDASVIEVNAVQPLKPLTPMEVTLSGIDILVNEEQF